MQKKLKMRSNIILLISLFLSICLRSQTYKNVILIYTDDLGYGDISLNGGLIPTPNIDALAHKGIHFTNAYATSATCTPSRYSLLTGEYAWRAKGRGVAQGNASALIQENQETLPKVFKRAGYKTGIIGKWHLGLGGSEGPDWNGKIAPGPIETGFDYAFIIPATGDRVPTVFVENHHVWNLDPNDPITVSYGEKLTDIPTGKDNPDLLKLMYSHGHDQSITNGISRIGYMTGGQKALWRDEDIADLLIEKAQSFIDQKSTTPFFLFFSTHDIHVPRIAHERFQGKTEFGPRGDVILQLDETVGALVQKLKELHLLDHTLILFTSDNGPVLDDGYEDQAKEKIGKHQPSRGLRGGKYSSFEAGTKVPFILFSNSFKESQRSEALLSQVDLLASFSNYLNVDYDSLQAQDSENHWEAFMGKTLIGRKAIVQEAIQNNLSYIRADGYKFIPAHPGPAFVPWGTEIETGFSLSDQLYYLPNDPAEQHNLALKKPELVLELKTELDKIIKGDSQE
jgi:arylsulfatase A-like enzyme